MTQPNAQFYGLDALHIFPYFPTRESYRLATSQEPPPYDDSKRAKYWRDVNALTADPDEPITYQVAYNSRGGFFTDASGAPRLGAMSLMPADAGVVNIPDKGVGMFPGTASGVEIQPPMRALLPNEKLVPQAGIANAQLRIQRTDLTPPTLQPATFTSDDRVLLQRIAAKVGA